MEKAKKILSQKFVASYSSAKFLKELLPASETLAVDHSGCCVLMFADCRTPEKCSNGLLPESNLLAEDQKWRKASELTRDQGHQKLAEMLFSSEQT